MNVKFWGVRGSLPSSYTPQQWYQNTESILLKFFRRGFTHAGDIQEFLTSYPFQTIGGWGTATTCIEVKTKQTQIIIDGGSGIRNLAEEMMKGPAGQGKAEIHIMMTHFHWDHMIGLPFFTPMFIPGNKIHFYAVQPELQEALRTKFKKPFFPVAFEALPTQLEFHALEPRKPFKIGDFEVTPYQLDHPDPCWGYRVVNDGRVYSHCVDTENTRTSREALGPDLPLYQGVDLMYFDAQYTLPELAEKINWGHSAAQLGLDIAIRENIKNIIFGHHDPGASIEQIFELQKQTHEYYNWRVKTAETNRIKLPPVQWSFGHEGLDIEI